MDDTREVRSSRRDDEAERFSRKDQVSHPSATTLQQIRKTAAARIGDVLSLMMIQPRYRYVCLQTWNGSYWRRCSVLGIEREARY